MNTPFDQLAPQYASLWSDTPTGRSQRAQVWRDIDGLFRRGDRVLDLGCGTGDDAVYLAERGVNVLAVDSSAEMIEVAVSRGVSARQIAIEEVAALKSTFDGVISNFGALNCVADLAIVAGQVATILPAHAPFVVCVIGRFSVVETLRYLFKGEFKRAMRRWPGRAEWRGMTVYYRSAREIQRSLAPWFALERRASVGRGDHQLYIFRRSAA